MHTQSFAHYHQITHQRDQSCIIVTTKIQFVFWIVVYTLLEHNNIAASFHLDDCRKRSDNSQRYFFSTFLI